MKGNRWLVVLAAVWLLVGCTAAPEKTRRPDSDWSRGLALGRDAGGPVSLTFDARQGRLWAVWPLDDASGVHRVAVDASGLPLQERVARLHTAGVRSVRLLWLGDTPWLFWAGHVSGQADRLWRAPWPVDAEAPGAAQALSGGEAGVLTTDAVRLPDGGVAVVWADKSGALFLSAWDAAGTRLADGRPLATGRLPALAADPAGRLHLAWQDAEGALRYRRLGADGRWLSDPFRLQPPQVEGSHLAHLDIAASGEQVVVMWSVVQRSGMEAGTAYTAWLAFPPDGAPGDTVERLWLSPAEHPLYRAVEPQGGMARLSPPAPVGRGSDYVEAPTLLAAPDGAVWFAVAWMQALRLDRQMQIAVGRLAQGAVVGMQPATYTETFSGHPALAQDVDGYLHLAWQEGAAQRKVFYATTAPAARARLNRLTPADVVGALARGGMESLVGIALFPVAFLWLLPGLLIVGLWALLGWAYLEQRPAWPGLVLAGLAYLGAKAAFLPTLWTYVPFSAWLDLPAGLGEALRLGMPALILLLAVGWAGWGRRRWRVNSVAGLFLLFAGADALLTLAVYGVNLLGVF